MDDDLTEAQINRFNALMVLRIPLPTFEKFKKKADKMKLTTDALAYQIIENFSKDQMFARSEFVKAKAFISPIACESEEEKEVIYFMRQSRTLGEIQDFMNPNLGHVKAFLQNLEAKGWFINKRYVHQTKEFSLWLNFIHPQLGSDEPSLV